ncbi:3575_t:CDS:2 [Entrophospora sp. SA101]|nr:3575_t:CDS:2 [Entrophospora sp. SA101]
MQVSGLGSNKKICLESQETTKSTEGSELNNCFSSPDNNNSNDNTEIDYEIIQINENNCTQAESNKMVPAFIQQKFLQIIASSNDEVNEQSKKINSSKRVLDLEIASGLQPRITSQFQKYNISQGQSKLYRRTLSTKLIDKEVARISISIEKELKSEENLSLVVDSWKSNQHHSYLNDRNFWANVECLTYVSSPAKKAVKCIESANSTLADFFLILIQMAATIKQLPISDSTEHKGFQRQFFHSVIRTALEVWKNLGGGDKSAQERENFNRPLEDIEDYGDPDYNIDVIRDSGI